MSLDPISVIGWCIILAAMGAWEARGLMRKRKGDTLSELTWFVLAKAMVLRFFVLGFLFWLAVHFFFLGRYG